MAQQRVLFAQKPELAAAHATAMLPVIELFFCFCAVQYQGKPLTVYDDASSAEIDEQFACIAELCPGLDTNSTTATDLRNPSQVRCS